MRWEKERKKVRNGWSGNTEGGGSFSKVPQENQERLVSMRRAVAHTHTFIERVLKVDITHMTSYLLLQHTQ